MAKNLQAGLRQSMKASREAGLTGNGVFSRASLDLRFAMQKTLDPRVTFTRASSGTYVGSDGLLKTAVTNLVTYSEQFDNAAWTKTDCTITANTIVSPNGLLTGDSITSNAGVLGRISRNTDQITDTTYTFSTFAKANQYTFCQLRITGAVVAAITRAYFNLATGTITGAVNCTASIAPVGDGWYRCSITYTTTSTATATPRIYGQLDSSDANVGDGTSGIYIWGAQMEQASTVGEYIPTVAAINSAPRFDHNPTTGESLGLLVEEARTNLLLRSEEFNTTWTKAAASVTDNQRVAPDGTTTMDTIALTGGSGYLQQAITSVSTTVYTQSIYVFSASNRMRLIAHNGTVDICNITWTSVSANTNTATGTATGITSTLVGSGIYRLTFSFTASSSTTNIRLQPLDSSGAAVVGATADFWGAQLEAGAFATSYIPTVAATVTRAADVASITGSNFSSFYNQTEGAVFSSFRRISYTGTSTVVSINDNTTNNRLYNLRQDTAAALTVISATAGSVDASPSLTLSSGASADQVAVAQQLNNFGASANGGTVATDSTVLMPTVTQANIGNVTSSSFFNGTIKRLTYWPTRLANTTLQQITQP